MNLLKKFGAVVFALAFFVALAVVVKPTVKAATSEVQLRTLTAVSPDNGQTWTTDTCLPPDSMVQIRTRVWNEGTDDVYKLYGTTALNDDDSLRDCTPTNPNEDGDDYAYSHPPFADSGTIETGFIGANGSETSGEQGAIATCRVAAPCDETIRGTVVLTRFFTDDGEPTNNGGDQVFIRRALAAIGYPDANSTFTVRVAGGTCPNACDGSKTTTTTASSTITSLPETGSSLLDLIGTIF